MNRQFIQVTHGLVPVAVLLLLAIALVAGQARATFAGQSGIDRGGLAEHRPVPANVQQSVQAEPGTESLPDALTTFVTLPAEIELTINLLGKSAKSASAAHPAVSSQ